MDITAVFAPSPPTPDPNITSYAQQWFNGDTPGSGSAVGSPQTIARQNPEPSSYPGVNLLAADPGINLMAGQAYYFSVTATDSATGLTSAPIYSNVVTLQPAPPPPPPLAPAPPASATAAQV